MTKLTLGDLDGLSGILTVVDVDSKMFRIGDICMFAIEKDGQCLGFQLIETLHDSMIEFKEPVHLTRNFQVDGNGNVILWDLIEFENLDKDPVLIIGTNWENGKPGFVFDYYPVNQLNNQDHLDWYLALNNVTERTWSEPVSEN